MNRGKGIATVASQLRELGFLSEEFFSSENNDSVSSSSKKSKIKEKFDAIDEENRNAEYIFDEVLKDQDILALVQFDQSGELFDIINKIFAQNKPSNITNGLKENQVKIKSYINLIGSSLDIDQKVKGFLLELFYIDNLIGLLSQLPDDKDGSMISFMINNISKSSEAKSAQELSKEIPQPSEIPKPTKSPNTPKDNIISILTRDTKNASTQIFNDEYIPLLANILFDTDRVKIEKYISNLKQKATKEQIQEYINVITDPGVKKIFAKLQDTKELNNASDILKNNTSASLNLYAILSVSDNNNSAESINTPLVLEKNFQKLRNNLYKHFNNTNRSELNYWLNFMYLKDFNGEKIVVNIPKILFNEIEIDIVDENNDIIITHPVPIFLNSIRSDLHNGRIQFDYAVDADEFIKSNGDTKNISGYRATINNFLRKNDINVSPIPSYYDMSYNGFDNKVGSKANKLKLIIMQNIYSKRIFGLKLYKSDYGFLYAYLNHLVRAQGKRAFVISAKNLGKLYGSDFNPSNTSKIKRSEILEKNSDIIVVEDADYFRDRAEKTRDRLKGLGKTVILLGNQSSSFDNPFGDLCQTSMIYDLPTSSKKSQKEIFAKIYNNQLSSLFKITLSPNTLEVLPIMIGSINRNYGNIKAIFDKVSIDQEKIKEYVGKDMILELGDSYHKALSTQDIGEIVLFLKIYGNGFELSIDDIDDCMRSFYGKEHVAEGGYSEEMSSLAYNILTKPYSSDILGIPLAIQNSSDTKKLVKDKYKVDKLDTNSSLHEIITDNSMLLEFVDILNKKIIKKYYNTTGDL